MIDTHKHRRREGVQRTSCQKHDRKPTSAANLIDKITNAHSITISTINVHVQNKIEFSSPVGWSVCLRTDTVCWTHGIGYEHATVTLSRNLSPTHLCVSLRTFISTKPSSRNYSLNHPAGRATKLFPFRNIELMAFRAVRRKGTPFC